MSIFDTSTFYFKRKKGDTWILYRQLNNVNMARRSRRLLKFNIKTGKWNSTTDKLFKTNIEHWDHKIDQQEAEEMKAIVFLELKMREHLND